MARVRRQFSVEYKQEAVRLVEAGQPVLEVARSLGIRADMLRKLRYACIHRHRSAYAVALMCRVLRVSRAGYHAWRRFRVATDSRHGEPIAPNRLQRQFAVTTIPGVDHRLQ